PHRERVTEVGCALDLSLEYPPRSDVECRTCRGVDIADRCCHTGLPRYRLHRRKVGHQDDIAIPGMPTGVFEAIDQRVTDVPPEDNVGDHRAPVSYGTEKVLRRHPLAAEQAVDVGSAELYRPDTGALEEFAARD